MEENRLRKEMKDTEAKLILKSSNNISQTQQEILQDLNNFLKNDENDNSKGNVKEEKNSRSNSNLQRNNIIPNSEQIIEEEQTHVNDTQSIIKANVNKPKGYKCKILL